MALQHIVWLKQREDTAAADMEKLMEEMHGLVHSIPGVVAVSAGPNITDRALGFTHGAIITLESEASLEGYKVHPAHQAVVTLIKAACSETIVLDFIAPN